MLEKFNGIGKQAANTASDAVHGVTASVKNGAESIANAAISASEAMNEKAVRASTAQMCTILEIAIAELQTRPLSERPVSLTAAVNFGVGTLEMQIHLPPGKDQDTSGSETESLPSGASQDGAEGRPQGGVADR